MNVILGLYVFPCQPCLFGPTMPHNAHLLNYFSYFFFPFNTRSCAAPLCPARSQLLRSVCGRTWWSRSRFTDARPTTTPASRGRTTPAPGTVASHRPRRSSWTARSLNHTWLRTAKINVNDSIEILKIRQRDFFDKKVKLMWLKITCWSENNLRPLFVFVSVRKGNISTSASADYKEAQRLFSDTASVKANKIASWDIDWSSDDVTSSWGWRQEDLNSSVRQSTSCPAKLFKRLCSPTPPIKPPPRLYNGRSFVTHRVSTFITSFSILFQSQIPSCLFLNDCLPLSFSLSLSLSRSLTLRTLN